MHRIFYCRFFESLDKDARIESLDFLKLFAAFLVVFSHCIMKFVPEVVATPIYNCIWLLQMPLFMFVSGFLSAKTKPISSISHLGYRFIRNCLSLLYPCVTFLFLTCFVYRTNPLEALASFYYDPNNNLWFLWALFVIHTLFDFNLFLAKFFPDKIAKMLPVFLIILFSALIILAMRLFPRFNPTILSLKLIAYYILFFCFGYIFRMVIFTGFFKTKLGSVFATILFIVSLAVFLFDVFYFKSIYRFNDNDPKQMLIRVTGSLCGIYVCVCAADFLCRIKFFSRLSRGGRFSLETYYLHILLIRVINFSPENPANQWLVAVGATVLLIFGVGACLLISYFIPFSHLLLFGRSFSAYRFEKRLPMVFR